MSDDVVIGKFGRPHGVRGEVRLFQYNPNSELLDAGLEVFVDGDEALVVASVRPADKFLIVTLEGINGREEATRLRNQEVRIPRDVLPEPDEDEFYLVDVVGFEVWAPATEGADPKQLGTLKGWLDVGPTEIMAVTGPDIRGRMLVPFIDHVVDDVDFDAERITLRPLETWAATEDG